MGKNCKGKDCSICGWKYKNGKRKAVKKDTDKKKK